MPSARDPFTKVQIGPKTTSFAGFSIHLRSSKITLQFKSSAEVNAEVRTFARYAICHPKRGYLKLIKKLRKSSEAFVPIFEFSCVPNEQVHKSRKRLRQKVQQR